MRIVAPAALTALAQPTVPLALLIDMQLSQPFRVTTAAWDLEWAGKTYTGAGLAGAVDPIEDSPSELKGLRLTLSGVPSELIALALAEPIQGKPVTVSTAIFSNTTYRVLDAVVDWSGRCDVFNIEEDNGTATLQVTAEHSGIDLLRADTVRYSHADQQRLYAGDRGLEYVIDQSDKPIVWPSRDFWKK